jgi:hypothetical protein
MSICGGPIGFGAVSTEKLCGPTARICGLIEQPGDVQNSKFDEMICFVIW